MRQVTLVLQDAPFQAHKALLPGAAAYDVLGLGLIKGIGHATLRFFSVSRESISSCQSQKF